MKKQNFKKWTPVEITWLDSTHASGWTFDDASKPKDEHLEQITVGYFRCNTDKSINVVQSMSANEHYDGSRSIDARMQIPWCAIIKVKKLV